MAVAPSSVSTSTIISTLLANLALFGVFVGCFIVLRLKFKRIYSPKSSFDLVPEDPSHYLKTHSDGYLSYLLSLIPSFYNKLGSMGLCFSDI